MIVMDEFELELEQLLKKHSVAIVCRSGSNQDDNSVVIGFQNMANGLKNKWTDRHNITSFDLDSN